MTSGTALFLIRHGETEWNRAKRIQGHLDIPLSAEGMRQAGQLAARGALPRGGAESLDAIYSSDLSRAHQTALPLAQALGLPVSTTADLRERHYGIFQGLTPGEAETKHPEAFARWQSRDASFAMPQGESLTGFYERIIACVRNLVARHPGQRIVLVAHGGVLDCLYRFATGLTLDAPRTHALLNASLNRIDVTADSCCVVFWGDVSHLETNDAADEFSEGERSGAALPGVPNDRIDPRVL